MGSNICNNCGDSFPNRVEIDGKVRNLYSRKYCLTCSPFGEHNTSQLDKPGEGDEMVCDVCDREFIYDRSKGHRRNKCNSCCVIERRHRDKERLVEMFGGECEICGYSECIQVLSFHHINPDNKKFGVTESITTRKWENVVEEANKCKLLCANCHREEHCRSDHFERFK